MSLLTRRGTVTNATLLLALLPLACTSPSLPCGPEGCGDPPVTTTDGGTGGDAGAGPAHRYASLLIEPADVELTTTLGEPVSQAFLAWGITGDGQREALDGHAWSVEGLALGRVTTGGRFDADGRVAGTATLRVQLAEDGGATLSATTRITVVVSESLSLPGAPIDAATRFENASPGTDPAQAVAVRYPLDGAMMPRNVPAPELQWTGGADGDLLRIRFTRGKATAQVYLANDAEDGKGAWLVDTAVWRLLALSDSDERIAITVDRLPRDGDVFFSSPAVNLRISRGSLYGLIYYWQLTPGRILRINAETGERENLVENPPAYPPGTDSCMACHAVAPNGRYLAGQVGNPQARKGSLYDLTVDLGGSPAPSLYPINQVAWGPSSFSPDSTRLVVSSMPGLAIIDPLAGQSLSVTGLPTTAANHPAWSPDGTAIAYVATDATWSYEFQDGDLMLAPQTGPDSFGTPVRLHLGSSLSDAPEGGTADLRPSWTPDSQFLAFGHGRQQANAQRGALYLIARDGSGLVRLARASEGPGGSQAFWPTFAGYVTTEEDGERYYWMGYYSTRPYGHRTGDVDGHGVRQLWVSAIKANAAAGEDPSQVPYWLPGQSTSDENIAAQWAAAACRANKDECTSDAQCCTGNCSAGQCEAPPAGACRQQGQTCSESTDCCDGSLACIANICSTP